MTTTTNSAASQPASNAGSGYGDGEYVQVPPAHANEATQDAAAAANTANDDDDAAALAPADAENGDENLLVANMTALALP